ncbi:MAG: acetylxylan esterase [Planctomycetes bacterium]|nr:acetylxylan esterase [Planctomycetota bacterium]
MRYSLVLLLALPLFARAQEDLTVLPAKGETPLRKMLHGYLIGQTQKHFDARRETLAAIKTPEDLRKRESALREKFIDAIGGFPDKTPLNAQVITTHEIDGTRIENIIFESRPGHHVTANLYLPKGKGPFPAVLMPIGHSANGKAAMKSSGMLLARNGIASFAYDPISQGERRQLLDEKGKPFIPSMTSEHTMITVGAVLVGRSTASYRIWDGIRAIDYLSSRPEIDAKRLGCTGCSGGGTMTSYLMALDDRILAAAPSCYVTSLERLFATIGPQDAEQNITGQVAFGLEHADYLMMRAPKPTLILAASKDFFDIQGTWTTFREAKRFYTMLGVPERVDLVETDTTHGYPKGHREAMLRWMSRWLLDKDMPLVEEMMTLPKDSDLLCTRTGQVLEDLKGKSVFDVTAERARELVKVRAKSTMTAEDLRKQVAKKIGVTLPVPAAKVAKGDIIERKEYRITKLIFTTEPGISVPGLLFEKKGQATGPLIIYLHGLGKNTDAGVDGEIEKSVLRGNRVLAIDPRGFGETSAGVPSGKPSHFGVDFTTAFLGLHLDRPLLGQRTFDVLSVIEKMAADSKGEIHLVGIGSASAIALHVAALDQRISKTSVENGVLSWTNVATTAVSFDQLTHVVPNALAVYDLPELASLIAPRALWIRGTLDAALKPVSRKVVEETYAPAIATYRSLKVEKNFFISEWR